MLGKDGFHISSTTMDKQKEMRFLELEQQLEFAESRCGTLKQQLDYIKSLYGGVNPATNDKLLLKSAEEKDTKKDASHKFHESYEEKFNQCVVTDLAELEESLVSRSNTTTEHSRASTNRQLHEKFRNSKPKRREIKTKFSKPLHKRRYRKGYKSYTTKETYLVEGRSRKNRRFPMKCYGDNLVQIYKNIYSNPDVESSVDDGRIKKRKTESLGNVNAKSSELVIIIKSATDCTENCKVEREPSNSNEKVRKRKVVEETKNDNTKRNKEKVVSFFRDEGTVQETFTSGESNTTKRYNKPTLASQLKQSERNIFTNTNFRNIPFVAAKSTAPSHNIGLNIQQVLSHMKKWHFMPHGNTHLEGNTELLSSTTNFKKEKQLSRYESGGGDYDVEIKGNKKIKSLKTLKFNTYENKKESGVSSQHSEESLIMEENENEEPDLNFKFDKLKKVLIFLKEDFIQLSQKYKRLQKKLNKRNIPKVQVKNEIQEIERTIERKEEEIRVVISLYREVLHLQNEIRSLREQSTENIQVFKSNHEPQKEPNLRMTTLLRRIQGFQDKLLKNV